MLNYKLTTQNGKMVYKLYYNDRCNFTILFIFVRLGMMLLEFLNIIEKFNGEFTDNNCEVFFKTTKDAQDCIDYIESIMMADKLRSDPNV